MKLLSFGPLGLLQSSPRVPKENDHAQRAMGAVAVTGIAALITSACGGSLTPAAKPSARSAAAPAPATSGAPVRDAGADLVIWADNDRAPVIQKYADAFGKEHGIKVVV